jgi:hypothetical protein
MTLLSLNISLTWEVFLAPSIPAIAPDVAPVDARRRTVRRAARAVDVMKLPEIDLLDTELPETALGLRNQIGGASVRRQASTDPAPDA